jgi:hypothetical protein
MVGRPLTAASSNERSLNKLIAFRRAEILASGVSGVAVFARRWDEVIALWDQRLCEEPCVEQNMRVTRLGEGDASGCKCLTRCREVSQSVVIFSTC